MNGIRIFGRIVCQITSEAGRQDYYDYLNYWRGAIRNTNRCILPTKEDAENYLRLKVEKLSIFGDLEMRKRCRRLEQYNYRYDWRPRKSGTDKSLGLESPTGEQLLPNLFADVFTQFDAINHSLAFIPVSNGEAWALVSQTSPTILMTDFSYEAIIPERWEHNIYFVQDKKTKKWGALAVDSVSVNENSRRFRLPYLSQLMPCIADEIYEDQLMTEDAPTLFFMTRIGNKVGILTQFGYSPIIYDRYEANSENLKFRLIRNDRKRAKCVDFRHPK